MVHPVATSKTLNVGSFTSSESAAQHFAYDPTGPFAANTHALKQQVVRIVVDHGSGIAAGAGVIVCLRPKRAYVLTARHVLVGGGLPNQHGEVPEVFRGVRSITVQFYDEKVASVSGAPAEFIASQDSENDIALLSIPIARSDTLRIAQSGTADALRAGASLRTIGHSTINENRWLPEFATVNEVRDAIIFRPALDTGYSGGPVYDDQGRLVGINSHVIGGITEAVLIDRALSIVRGGMPPECLRGLPALSRSGGSVARE